MRLMCLMSYNGLVRGLTGLGTEDVGVQVPVEVPLLSGESCALIERRAGL